MLTATIYGLIMTIVFGLYNGMKIRERFQKPLDLWNKKQKTVSLIIFGLLMAYSFVIMFNGNAALGAFSVMGLMAWRDQANKWIRLKMNQSYAEASMASKAWHYIGVGVRALWVFVAMWRIMDGTDVYFTWIEYILAGVSVNILYDFVINLIVPKFGAFYVDKRKHSFNWFVVNKLLWGYEWLFWTLKGVLIATTVAIYVL